MQQEPEEGAREMRCRDRADRLLVMQMTASLLNRFLFIFIFIFPFLLFVGGVSYSRRTILVD